MTVYAVERDRKREKEIKLVLLTFEILNVHEAGCSIAYTDLLLLMPLLMYASGYLIFNNKHNNNNCRGIRDNKNNNILI